jgi:hypothetical protein
MNRARRRALLVLLFAASAATAIGFSVIRHAPPGPQASAQRPALLLLTSLPLMFNEDFELSESGSPALRKLETRYRVVPISVADGAELAKGRLILMAHPPAQTAENLVVLDEWVRRGGHAMVLADPLLEWPSKRAPGDPLRPPPMFMDTGLLVHWGLRLDAPDRRGPAERSLGGYRIVTVSPGELSGTCAISSDRLVARCSIGAGRATIVADADFLDVNQFGVGAEHNLDGLLAELARVGHP